MSHFTKIKDVPQTHILCFLVSQYEIENPSVFPNNHYYDTLCSPLVSNKQNPQDTS